MKIGALEAGGTKMVLAVFDENQHMLDTQTIPTETPEITLPAMVAYFRSHPVDALGIASFGPLDLKEGSPTYGSITSTPKLAWQNTPLLSVFRQELGIPVAIDTDVNAAALAEYRIGAAQGADTVVYITVGTGIGGGIVACGKPQHGLLHPEIGHMLLRPCPEDTLPHGVCSFHDGCLEGLASGPALHARLGENAKTAPDDDPVFGWEVAYLAQMCVNLIVTLSPNKIVLGGGVMARKGLLPRIRKETVSLLNGYLRLPEATENGIDQWIVEPALYPLSGLVGAYLLGKGCIAE